MKGKAANAIALAAACALALSGLGCSSLGSADSVVSAAQGTPAAVSPVPLDVNSYVPGELIVGLADVGVDAVFADAARQAIESTGARVSETLVGASGHRGTMLLVSTDGDHRKGDGLAQAAEAIASQRGISYVQPNYRYTAATNAGEVAHDQDVGGQYYLNDWSDHGANVAAAWGKVDSSDKVDVAVLDTGVYVMREYAPDGSLRMGDDASDGFRISDNFHQEFDESNLDLADGRDFVHAKRSTDAAGDSEEAVEPTEPLPLVNEDNPYGDDSGHGTHIAGIIAANAQTDESSDVLPVGMAGVSQNARIIPLKVLDADGVGSTDTLVRAYEYLIQKKESGELPNLHVINLSLALMVAEGDDGADDEGGQDDSDPDDPAEWVDDQTKLDSLAGGEADGDGSTDGDGDGNPVNTGFQELIQRAQKSGIATVCAVGNKENESLVYESYPSAYKECISVTAFDENGRDTTYANNNGDEDIAAPGSGIYSAWGSQADAYATFDGTSQATAIVSGALSMLWAKKPELTVDEAKAALYATAVNKVEKLSSTGGSGSEGAQKIQGVQSGPDDSSATAASTPPAGVPVAQTNAGGGLSVGALAPESTATAKAVKQHYALDVASALDKIGDISKPSEPTTLTSSAVTLKKTSLAYTGKALEPAVTVKVNGATLKKGTDYTLTYSGNTNVTKKATVKVKGKGSYTGTVTKTFKITPASLTKGMVSLPKTEYAYAGKALKPVPVVKIGSLRVAATNYQVSYKNNKNVGTATVAVKGKNNLASATVSKTFKIKPMSTAIAKLTPGSKRFTVTWKKRTAQTTGYQVRYSLKKTMASATTKTIAKASTTKLTVPKLKKGKVYYVQVRTYKVVGKTKCYSAWSAVKSTRVR